MVKEFWNVLESEGLLASLEFLREHSHEDAELRPYVGEGRVFHGVGEFREFVREELAAGATLNASPWSFEEVGDDVVVAGSIRVQRTDGSIADAQVRWTFTFRDGRVAAAASAPLAA
jgi:ketosteroid isomerase-like protein